MENNSKLNFPFEILLLIIVILGAIGVTLRAIGPELFAQFVKPTPTVMDSTLIPTTNYKAEIVPASTASPEATQTSTSLPTDTPIPTHTSTPALTTPITRPLPDLTVTGISDPVCMQGTFDDVVRNYAKVTVVVWNIGHGSTWHFGTVDVNISLILGQTHYSLVEWATQFDGMISVPNLTIANLNPDRSISFNLYIDLKGNRNFGVEATANSGVNPIPELDKSNNTLIKYFTIYCY